MKASSCVKLINPPKGWQWAFCGSLALLFTAISSAARVDPAETPLYASLLLSAAPGFTGPAGNQVPDATRDFGPHPGTQHDLWHLYGQLHSANGSPYGINVVLLRAGVTASRPVVQKMSAWRMHEFLVGRIEVTDGSDGRLLQDSRVSRVALGLSGTTGPEAAATPGSQVQRVWIGDWQLVQGPQNGMQFTATTGFGSLALSGQPQRAASTEPASASTGPARGYVVTRLPMSGHFVRSEATIPLHGELWLERVWGQVPLSTGQLASTRIALHFADGRDLMLTILQRRVGAAPPLIRGSLMDAGGGVQALSSSDIQVRALKTLVTPDGEVSYPSAWHLTVASAALDAEVRFPTGLLESRDWPRHWSGPLQVSGAGAARAAEGYAHQVGYAPD